MRGDRIRWFRLGETQVSRLCTQVQAGGRLGVGSRIAHQIRSPVNQKLPAVGLSGRRPPCVGLIGNPNLELAARRTVLRLRYGIRDPTTDSPVSFDSPTVRAKDNPIATNEWSLMGILRGDGTESMWEPWGHGLVAEHMRGSGAPIPIWKLAEKFCATGGRLTGRTDR